MVAIINHKIGKIVDTYFDGNRAAMAKVLGISAENIRNYINGREPSISFLKLLHEKLAIPYSWILSDVDDPIPTNAELYIQNLTKLVLHLTDEIEKLKSAQ